MRSYGARNETGRRSPLVAEARKVYILYLLHSQKVKGSVGCKALPSGVKNYDGVFHFTYFSVEIGTENTRASESFQ